MVIFQHEGVIYPKMMKELAQASTMNQAQKKAFSQVKEECHDIIAKANAMLKGFPLDEKKEAELVVALDIVCENLHRNITFDCPDGRVHGHRNYQ